jgi:hypothetical protein
MNNYNNPKQSPEEPHLLRMFHPTAGRQGFNEVNNQPVFPSSMSVDPRLAMMINMQTQQAIGASGIPGGFPYQSPMTPMPSSYMYGIYQPYSMYPRRS